MTNSAGAAKQRKIAILGTTPSRMQAPLKDESWEIWTIGPGGKDANRWSRLFETHTVWPLDFGELKDDKSYLDDLSKVDGEQSVYSIVDMKTHLPRWAHDHGKNDDWLKANVRGEWKTNVVIDREALFTKYRRMWFSTSICYALALAIEEGATDIGCWGIDLESGEEYISQHAGCAHFLDLARLLGINLHFPNGCGLTRDLNPYPDRYETHLSLTLEKKAAWLQHMIGEHEPQYEAVRAEMFRIEGASIILKKILARNTPVTQEEIALADQELMNANRKQGQLASNINHLKGELSATQYYRRMYVWGMIDPA